MACEPRVLCMCRKSRSQYEMIAGLVITHSKAKLGWNKTQITGQETGSSNTGYYIVKGHHSMPYVETLD